MNIYWILLIIAGVNSSIGNYFLKLSQKKPLFLDALFSLEFFIGCFFYFLNVLFFAYSLKFLDVSRAYPILAAISFASVTFIGAFFLNEAISLKHIAGMILIVFSIYLIVSK